MNQTDSINQSEPDAKIRLRLWLRLLKASRSIESVIRENLRTQFATTLPRFDVMSALSRYDKGLKMSALSGVLKVSNGNVTGIVDRLVQDGLAIRVPVAGDRRAHLARLTKKGSDEFAVQAAAHEGWINDLLSGFDADTAAALCAHLDTAAPATDET
ncbi:MAG: MarR family winged helix-turn-helix transcriptional regulator [Rhodobacterales bacterium]|nr:MarR family winged helix-turn-helix transcriptional regulator [Rhodobacterales bacterium]